MQCPLAKVLLVVRVHPYQQNFLIMDISQIFNAAGVFILGILTKWLYDANKRDKLKNKNNGKDK